MAKPRHLPLPARRALSVEERALFQAVVGDVTPLSVPERRSLQPRRLTPLPAPARPVAHAPLAVSAPEWIELHAHGELLHYRDHSVSHRLLHELRRGHWPIGAEIDLHGVTREEALHLLGAFLGEVRQRGIRCVRIIHGKGYRSPGGQSALKGLVRHWLTQLPQVLAFSETRPQEGGSGAVKVLLRQA
ncbi:MULTISPECIES: Smr/MutS family protein [Leeia]|uniref:DNA mismatch repair protein MutS n=1 Tax=Leeia aquatica TaxID=2725557 RepID=A0A847SC00_9NEIS|nr:Smr/MutS family protein [Leeia aquatica]NLR74648.1 DNA mismatch repair protein MutS [Leeia aquatica]